MECGRVWEWVRGGSGKDCFHHLAVDIVVGVGKWKLDAVRLLVAKSLLQRGRNEGTMLLPVRVLLCLIGYVNAKWAFAR